MVKIFSVGLIVVTTKLIVFPLGLEITTVALSPRFISEADVIVAIDFVVPENVLLIVATFPAEDMTLSLILYVVPWS